MEQEARSELLEVGGTARDTLSLLQSLIVCDSIVLDGRRAPEWHLPRFCARFADVFELSDLGDLWDPRIAEEDRLRSGTPDSDPFLVAGITYLRVAQKMGVYLLVHPSREQFLSKLALPVRTSAAQVAINTLERKMAGTEAARYAAIDFSVPPVADHAIFLHRQHGLDIASAVNELRDSNHARSFRGYCGKIDGELAQLPPRASVRPLQLLLADVSKLAETWERDLDEGVRHVTRRLSLRKLWGLGPALEALGLDAVTFRDPVLFAPRKPHLLFLNDLYRTPRTPAGL